MFMLAGCSDGGSESPEKPNPTPTPTPEETASITINSNIVTNGVAFEAKGGEKSVSFSSNKDWTLSIATPVNGTAWCTVSATSGAKGDATVKFTVKENAEYDDRSVSVTIKAGTASKTFTITQKCAEALLVTSAKFEVPQEGGVIEVEVKANVNYELQIAENAKSWISETKSRALTTKKHAFNVAANEEYEKREGEIYIKSGDKVETVKVYQAGGAILVLSKNEVNVSDKGETISVDIKSNIEYGIQMPDVDWINNVDNSRAASSHTLKYVVSANETYDNRSTEIIFYDKNSSLKDTLKVIQVQKDAIVISEKNITVNKEGGIIEVKLSTNVEVEVQIPSDVTWITQTNSRALTERFFYLKVSENSGENDRSAEITFKNKNSILSDKVVVTQKCPTPAGFADGVVTIKTAGTMKSLLGDDYLNITSLKVVGPINGDDIYYLRKMLGGSNFSKADWGKLTTLDLSEATIVEGGEWYYEYSSSYYGEKEYCYTSNNEIGDYMFYKCANLENMVLPNSVISIGSSAFRECSALTTVEIGNGVTSIGKYAFESCSALTTIKIPDSVTSIGNYAFYNCSVLTSIKIPDSVTSVGKSIFSGCFALTTVEIGSGVTSIGAEAFSNCSIKECYCYALTPPSLYYGYNYEYSFYNGIEEGAILYVPARKGSAYKSSNWSDYFDNIIEMD